MTSDKDADTDGSENIADHNRVLIWPFGDPDIPSGIKKNIPGVDPKHSLKDTPSKRA